MLVSLKQEKGPSLQNSKFNRGKRLSRWRNAAGGGLFVGSLRPESKAKLRLRTLGRKTNFWDEGRQPFEPLLGAVLALDLMCYRKAAPLLEAQVSLNKLMMTEGQG